MTERRRVRPGSILFLLLLVLCVFTLARNIGAGDSGIAYSQMCQYFREEKVQSFTITGDSLQAKLQDGTVVVCTIGSVETFYSDLDGLVQQQVESGIVKEQSFIHATNWVSALLPYVMGFIALLLIINLMGRMAGGNAAAQDKMAKFGQARVQMPGRGENRVTFDDVAGADEEKEELQEIVEFLREPDKYLQLGAHIPKGVLLVGPPVRAKRCWRSLWPGRRMWRFCPSRALILWRCMWAWAPAVCAICLSRRKSSPRPLYSSMRSTPWAAREAVAWAADTMSGSRP